jgi:plastocyanin
MTSKKETPKDLVNAQGRIKPVWRIRSFMLATIIGLAFVALALSACGEGEASPAASDGDTNGPAVVIRDLAFEPETLSVKAGDTVTWRWDDGAIDHDVMGDGLHSDVMSDGTFRHRFDKPGTYEYVCTLHPNMTGTIEVTD